MTTPIADAHDLDLLLDRLVRRAQIPHLLLGVLLLALGVGVLFFAFALLIRIRSAQLREAVRAVPARVRSIRLQTRKVGPFGIAAVATTFAVIAFDTANGARRTLHLQGKAAELAALVRAIAWACPGVRMDDPETVSVHVG